LLFSEQLQQKEIPVMPTLTHSALHKIMNEVIAVISIKKLKMISNDTEVMQNQQDGHMHTSFTNPYIPL